MNATEKLYIEKLKELVEELDYQLLNSSYNKKIHYSKAMDLHEEIASLEKQVEEPEPERMISEIEYKKAIAEISRLQKLLKLIEDSGDENI